MDENGIRSRVEDRQLRLRCADSEVPLYVAKRSGKVMVSAWYSSTASINPDARALARSIPFPCDTATDRELGRHTITTGMPTESNPVTLATRVIPITGARGSARFSVSSRLADRCVPRRKTFSVTPIKIRFRTGLGRSQHSSRRCVEIHYGDLDLHTGVRRHSK